MVLNPDTFADVILEQRDILRIPERTSGVIVYGEVAFPNGVEFRKKQTTKDYIEKVGRFSQKSNKSKVIVMSQNGRAELLKKGEKIQLRF